MEAIALAIVALIGLVVGSFLNVLIYRVPLKKSIAWPSSTCPNCDEPIKKYDNIPVISYLILKGKCRSCDEAISLQYPAIELLSGGLTVISFLYFGITLSAVLSSFFLLVLLTVAAIDIKHKIIPNVIILPAIAVSAIIVVVGEIFGYESLPLVGRASLALAVIGFLAGGGLLLVIALLWRGGMGGGDIKLAGFMGIFLGPFVLLGLFAGFLFGSVAGVVSMAVFHKDRRDLIPFGPFLSLGAIIGLFFGPAILNWYLSASGLG